MTEQHERSVELNRLAAKLRTLYLNSAENQYIYRAADEIDALDAENEKLRAQLAEIEKAEPVAEVLHHEGELIIDASLHFFDIHPIGTKLYTRPMPAQDVNSLDASLGKTAMRFVDRAGDVHPGIDGAETICAEFYKAMVSAIENYKGAK